MRQEFCLSPQEKTELLKAMRPSPVMYLSGGRFMGPSVQESANAAWCALGRQRGFDGMSVCPSEKGEDWFTAEVVELTEL